MPQAQQEADLRYLDEVGCAPRFPLSSSWARAGVRPLLRLEAPRGRRVTALGAWAPLGDRPAFRSTTSTGTIPSAVVLDFLWRDLGGMTTPLGEVPEGCVRARPLVVLLDNASAHLRARVREHRDLLARADSHLFSLPTYSPHLHPSEALWRQVKYQAIPVRRQRTLAALHQAVCDALDHYVHHPSLCDDNLRASA